MSVNYNRLLGDWRCLKAALSGTAEKTFREPGAWGPLGQVHDKISQQPCSWVPSSSQAFSWGEKPMFFYTGNSGDTSVK